jgi:hypothetical protein
MVGLLRFFSSSLLTILIGTLAWAGPVCVRVPEATAKLNQPSYKPHGRKRKPQAKEEPILFPKYTPLSATGKTEGRWWEVKTMEGRTLWVRYRDLTASMNCLSVKVGQSRMYRGPGTEFEKSEMASKGDVFKDLGGEDGWTQVESPDGKRAWINLDHTWKPAATVRLRFDP